MHVLSHLEMRTLGHIIYLEYNEYFWVATNEFCATIDVDTFMATYARSVFAVQTVSWLVGLLLSRCLVTHVSHENV